MKIKKRSIIPLKEITCFTNKGFKGGFARKEVLFPSRCEQNSTQIKYISVLVGHKNTLKV